MSPKALANANTAHPIAPSQPWHRTTRQRRAPRIRVLGRDYWLFPHPNGKGFQTVAIPGSMT